MLTGDAEVAGGQHHLAFAGGGWGPPKWPRHEEFTSLFGDPWKWPAAPGEKVIAAVDWATRGTFNLKFNRVAGSAGKDPKRTDWNLSTQFPPLTHPALIPGNQLPDGADEIEGCLALIIRIRTGKFVVWAGSDAQLQALWPSASQSIAEQVSSRSQSWRTWGVAEASFDGLESDVGSEPTDVNTDIASPSGEGDLSELGDEDLDGQATVARRKEQARLRKILIGDAELADCALCGSNLPVRYLVCAHIKRRADCSTEEKKDTANLMLACLFGCDALFETGDIVVLDSGQVICNPDREVAASIQSQVDEHILDGSLDGHCAAMSEGSKQYFAAHRESHSA